MRMDPIAIVGMGSIFPGSTEASGFWRDIVAGRDLMTDVPATHWRIEDYYDPDPNAPDKTYGKRGAFLPEVPFDFMKYGIPPSNLSSTDTSQLLGLLVAEATLLDATQGRFPQVDRERISVILGHTGATELLADMAARTRRPRWEEALRRRGFSDSEVNEISEEIAALTVPWTEASFPGLLGNVVAGRIANRLDLHGTNCIVDAACASSLAALNVGIAELTLRASDMALVGGIDTLNDPFMYMCFSKTPALSETGDCRPFSADADGTMLGEGVAIVALRRLEDAERDGDRIYAVIRGVGTSSDGKSKSVYAPVHEGQARALHRAYESAGYSPGTVELVEAHGTATAAGDIAEFTGLRQVFEAAGREDKGWCALGSVKSQIGHTKCTAGIAGLLKATMALHHKTLPPTIKVQQPNQSLEIAQSPFYLNTEARPWIRKPHHPRRASVSSFGFGGSNFHVTLEEYSGAANRPPRFRQAPTELMIWSAATPAALHTAVRTLRDSLSAGEPDRSRLEARARRSQEAFDPSLPSRLAVVAVDPEDLLRKLDRALRAVASAPEDAIASGDGVYYEHGADAGPLAFVFSGQGSQYVNMGRDLVVMFDAARGVWDRLADMDLGDRALEEVVFPRPAFSDAEKRANDRRLREPQWSQPAIAACSLAQLAVLQRLGLAAEVFAGHSFGELVALHAAGVFDDATLLRLARVRGELMYAASAEDTSMTAVFASPDEVRPLVEGAKDVVIANYNSPTQTVVSGTVQALNTIESEMSRNRINFKRLAVGAAFHSPLMQASVAPFTEYLETLDLTGPAKAVFACGSARPYGAQARGVITSLADQLQRPVRFVETIEAMYAAGTRTFIEVGPGSALTGLAGEILSGRPAHCIPLDRRGGQGVTSLWHALARLTALGVPLRYRSLWDEFGDPAPENAPDRKHCVNISGANYGRPYPPQADAPGPPSRVDRVPHDDTAPVPAEHPALFSTDEPPGGAGGPDDPGAAPVFQGPQTNGRASDEHTAEAQGLPPARTRVDERGNGYPTAAGPWPDPVPAQRIGTASLHERPRERAARGMESPGETAEDEAWLHALQELDHSTAAAEREFQDTLARSYEAYLETMRTAHERLEVLGTPGPAGGRVPDTFHPVGGTARPEQVSGAAPVPAPAPDWEASGAVAGPAAPPAPMATTGRTTGTRRALTDTLLAIVSEKTGYPIDLLDLDLEIESGLGIDSIKRVEIFSALQSRTPESAGGIEPAELLKLATLGDVVDFLESPKTPAAAPGAPALPPAGAAELPPEAAPNGPPHALTDTLLAIVSEKTGYPIDLLDLDLEIESGLGIDSIKRVEIFSALQSRTPESAGGIEPAELLKLATLRDVVEAVGSVAIEARGASGPASLAPANGSPAHAPHNAVEPVIFRAEPEAVEAPAAGLALAGLMDSGPLTIVARAFHDEDVEVETAFHLARILDARGIESKVATGLDAETRGVIFLGGMRPTTTIDQSLDVNEEAFRIAKQFAPSAEEHGGVFVTVQDTGGDFGLSGARGLKPWAGGIAALAKVASLEWPKASTKAIDLDLAGRGPLELATVLANELFDGGPEHEVGLGGAGQRRTIRVKPLSSDRIDAAVLEDDAVVVVSGGARGITFEALAEWAGQHRLRFVLLGSTRLEPEPACCAGLPDQPSLTAALLGEARVQGRELALTEAKTRAQRVLAGREVAANLLRLEALGARARYASVDVLDEIAVRRTLKDVREAWGPIRGLVHAAGVLNDRLIRDKTPEQFRRVVRTKVIGLQHLLEATKEDPLSLVCLFSSVAARAGNAGQCDYAMANEIMNKLANAERSKRGPECVVKSINWGPWEAGMVTPELKTRFDEAGISLLSVAQGARAFVDEASAAGWQSAEVLILPPSPAHPARAARMALPGWDRTFCADLEISAQRFPFIEDHRIGGAAVLPAVVVLEFFARMARAVRPDSTLQRIRNLRVLAGVRLGEDDLRKGLRLRISCREEASSADLTVLAMELLGGRQKHYQATAELGAPAFSIDRRPFSGSTGKAEQNSNPYHQTLFHGPSFQVIRSLEAVTPEGARATLLNTADKDWPGAPWLVDPAALDGGLQLALVWTDAVCGFKSLPTNLGEFALCGPHRPIAACELRARHASRMDALVDLAFLDDGNELVSEIRNLVMTMQPQATARAAS